MEIIVEYCLDLDLPIIFMSSLASVDLTIVIFLVLQDNFSILGHKNRFQ